MDWTKVRAQLDVDGFMRDGVAVFRGVFNDAMTRQLRQSCEHVQRLNDSWLDHDWHAPDQWRAKGLYPPTTHPLTEHEVAGARGSCQVVSRVLGRIFESVQESNRGTTAAFDLARSESADTPGKLRDPPVDMRDKQSMRWPLGRGIVPEHCAMAYDTFLAACITHPQTIALHQLLIGPNIRFDHNTLLSRRDFPGQHWHSHSYMEDDCGVTTRPGGASLRLVRSLIYPDGFADRNDGGLKVVPGAHLFRSATLQDSVPPFIRGPAAPGQDDDKYFESTWLAGKTHPITGEQLRIVRLSLPPGSIVACLGHMPHAVDPRPASSGTRHCVLFSYREPDPEGRLPVSSTNACLQPWELEADATAGKMPGVAAGAVNLFTGY